MIFTFTQSVSPPSWTEGPRPEWPRMITGNSII